VLEPNRWKYPEPPVALDPVGVEVGVIYGEDCGHALAFGQVDKSGVSEIHGRSQ